MAQTESQYNIRSPAVKRLYREAKELREDRTAEYFAQPLDDNLFEWHFTVRGPPDSDFAGGVYHGRIILPTEYPMKPPSIIMLTPNGRFEVNKKICLSISGHHPESWQPSWSIRTALLAIIGFMPTEGLGAIGSLDYPPEERKSLAQKSQNWCCPSCGLITKLLKSEESNSTESEANKEAKELAKQICFKENGKREQNSDSIVTEANPSDTSADSPTDSPDSSVETTTEPNPETEVHRRTVPQMHSNVNAFTNTNTANANLNSSSSGSRFTTYLIGVLCLAIGFLLFRRLFLL